MSKFKGTKGKLRLIDVHDDTATFDVKDVNNKCIATFWRYNRGVEVVGVYEQKANAVLFSKAPEMLEMLKRCADYFLNIPNNMQAEENAEAILQLIKEATE